MFNVNQYFVHIILAKYVVQSFNVDIENPLARRHSYVYLYTLFIKASFLSSIETTLNQRDSE